MLIFEWDAEKARENEQKHGVSFPEASEVFADDHSSSVSDPGVRGKYAKRYREGTNVVLIDPDLHKLFPNSEAVNRALREYASKKRTAN